MSSNRRDHGRWEQTGRRPIRAGAASRSRPRGTGIRHTRLRRGHSGCGLSIFLGCRRDSPHSAPPRALAAWCQKVQVGRTRPPRSSQDAGNRLRGTGASGIHGRAVDTRLARPAEPGARKARRRHELWAMPRGRARRFSVQVPELSCTHRLAHRCPQGRASSRHRGLHLVPP
jgi:hypothetical protein